MKFNQQLSSTPRLAGLQFDWSDSGTGGGSDDDVDDDADYDDDDDV